MWIYWSYFCKTVYILNTGIIVANWDNCRIFYILHQCSDLDIWGKHLRLYQKLFTRTCAIINQNTFQSLKNISALLSRLKTIKEDGCVFPFSWFWASTRLSLTRKGWPQSGFRRSLDDVCSVPNSKC